jgi:hypothetical protein
VGDPCIYNFLSLVLFHSLQTCFLLLFSLGLKVDLSQKLGGLLGLLAFQLNDVDAFKPLVVLVAQVDVLIAVTVDGRRHGFILHLNGQLVHRLGLEVLFDIILFRIICLVNDVLDTALGFRIPLFFVLGY